MIPIRLIIHNFRAIEFADIDLSAVSLAAIAGRNGAGKSSAFTLAPRFAVFGDVIKGVSLDDLVRKGVQEMMVTFEFEHRGSVFRAIRTRSTKGKGKTTLEFQELVNGSWESRSAEKIIDTEAVIRELLNLDDETFTASSMILQGQANAFTGATAGRRKEILSQILGLNTYEQLQERARLKAGVLHFEIEKSKDKLLTLNERLSEKPAKEVELGVASDQHSVTQDLIDADERKIKEAEAQWNTLKAKTSRIQQINKDIATIDEELSALHLEQAGHVGRLDRAEKILFNAEIIHAKAIELEQVKQQITALEARQHELDRLRKDLAGTVADLQQIDTSLTTTTSRILLLQQQLADRDKLHGQANLYEAELERLQVFESLADQWNLLVAELADLQSKRDREASRLTLEERLLTEKIAALEKQEAHIHNSGCLPTCKFQNEAAAAVLELPELRQQLNALDRTYLDALKSSIATAEDNQQSLEYDYAAHRACKVRVDELRAPASKFAQLAGKDELLEQTEEQQGDLEKRKADTQEREGILQQRVDGLNKAIAPLSELRNKAIELDRWARLKDQVSVAQEAKLNAEERITAINAEIIGKNERKDRLTVEYDLLVIETLEQDALQLELGRLQAALQQRRKQSSGLAELIGGIKAALATLELDQQERDRLAADMEPKAQRWARYQTLIKAFGRDGIPALIIENAVPQLERIANEILGQMSKGKHYVRFETQRELKSKAGLTETLDIMIGDWSAERPYETFSGGEQLRIDYAIRFALAELLAQRAGSKVEWLTIDEGLGSQDAEHRALVLESIKEVAGRFKKVLVITHIEDAQTAFDQVIRFDNADGGVEVHVA
ncbi:AAA family ATPase [Paenibacillus periandrae]|uniref:AAA family ATPase n=1 Tax=Paenibacillus periandrae TaxID=1761741 RepID=UPI001F08ACFC|nr:SMC family ATPase [Paenibacillus periandrae]